MNREVLKNSIGKRVKSLVVNVAFTALLVTGIISILSMYNIREKNKEILIAQMETSLYNRVRDKAQFADSELKKYIGYANMFADYINVLYQNPSKFMSKEVPVPARAPRYENAKRFVMFRTLLNENITYESVKEECNLLGNIEHVWEAFMQENRKVVLKSGVLMAYDLDPDLVKPREGQEEIYYDFTGSSWYSRGIKLQREGFTDVYYDN